jgi:dTDP-glucose 4,6-dehydratase
MVYQPRNVLVTGGAGFIGSTYVHHLLAAESAVRVVTLEALTYAGNRANLDGLPDPGRHRFVHGSINDGELVRRLLREHAIDTLVNFAAESHVDRSIAGPAAFVRTNVDGTFALLEAARDVWQGEQALAGEALAMTRRFHHISTDEVFGDLAPEAAPFSEASPYAPRSPYAASKAAADHLVRAWHTTFGLPAIITACSNNYGPRQHDEKFIPVVIAACRAGRAIPLYGDGAQRRDWLHVDDHCRGLLLALRALPPGSTRVIGGGQECSNLDLAGRLCALLDAALPASAPHARLLAHVADRPGHDRRYAIDASLLRADTGWRPRVAMEDGLAATVHWYLTRPA